MHAREEPLLANDDWPEYVVYVTDPGPRRAVIYLLYRRVLGISPAHAKLLLSSPRVEVARGPRMNIQQTFDEFRGAGATVEVIT